MPPQSRFSFGRDALRQACTSCKTMCSLSRPHFHDLRHEAISRFFEMGLTTPEVSSISGHRDIRILMRYAHPVRAEDYRIDGHGRDEKSFWSLLKRS
jgi:integrase